MTDETWTIGRLLKWTQDYFAQKDIASPRLDAEVLLAHATGLRRIELYTSFEREIGEEQRALLRGMVRERAEHRPTAYIVGEREFMSMKFRVTPDVLVPRPETEFVVEGVLDRIADRIADRNAEMLIADIGTGSGCIAIALAARLPNTRFVAVDISPAALVVARENAERHGMAERIEFVEGDMLAPLTTGDFAGRLDFLLSNPPYISEAEWPAVMPDVRLYEPKGALLAEGDALKFYRAIARGAQALVREDGWILVEAGAKRAREIAAIFAERAPGGKIGTIKDYDGVERVVTAQIKR